MAALELIRDVFDHTGVGVILIGMPGIEKRSSRNMSPSRFSMLSRKGMHIITPRGNRGNRHCGIFRDCRLAQAIASIARITGGNFRPLHRLFVQVERILKINQLTIITDDVVEAARSTFVVGVTKPAHSIGYQHAALNPRLSSAP
jgi:DNA transposition AAA+ family ATPase